MTRIFSGAALAAIVMASAAFAATPATTSIAKPVDYAARCTALAEQWKTAETANSANTNLGKAKADAGKASKLCASTKTADRKKGASDYETALKLLGVTPA